MQRWFFILFVSAGYLICACMSKSQFVFVNTSMDNATKANKVAMKDLIKNYRLYHGQYVETEGRLYYKPENVTVCKDDDECFGLNFSNDLPLNDSLLQYSSGSKYILKGKIDTLQKSQLNSNLSTISDIYYLRIR